MRDDTKYIVLVEKGNGEQMFTIEPNLKTATQNKQGHINAGFRAEVVRYNGYFV